MTSNKALEVTNSLPMRCSKVILTDDLSMKIRWRFASLGPYQPSATGGHVLYVRIVGAEDLSGIQQQLTWISPYEADLYVCKR
jgi:hypothetical protein